MNLNISKYRKLIIIISIIFISSVIWWLLQPTKEPDFASGNGRLEATEIDIATKYAGRISKIFVDEGAFVTAGQPLAQMQTEVLQAQRDEACAQAQQALNASESIAAQVAVRESDFAAAQAAVQQRISELEAAQKRFARSKTLAKEGAVSQQVLDDDRTAVHRAAAILSATKAQMVAASAAITATKAQLTGSQATIAALNATVARIDAEIVDSQLKAPCAGRIQYRIAQPGEVLGNGGKVLNLVDLSDVYITFFLPEIPAGKVALGSEARILLDALPYAIPAKISYIASTAQFTPKTVETASERQKLMFRVKAKINQDFLQKHLKHMKTGLPGVAWVKLNPQATWPQQLALSNDQT